MSAEGTAPTTPGGPETTPQTDAPMDAPMTAPVVDTPMAVESAESVSKPEELPEKKDPTGLERIVELMSISDSKAPQLTDEEKEVAESLRGLHTKHKSMEEEYHKEWNELKLKYLEQFRPLYTERTTILEKKDSEPSTDSFPAATRSLPFFWLRALSNHPMVNEMIEERDREILRYLKDIKFEWIDDTLQTSFRLTFDFVANPFLENSQLHKTYHLEKDEDGENVLTSTEGTEIVWKANMDATKKVVMRKQRNKRTSQVRVVKQIEEEESFFNFFKSNEIPSTEALEKMQMAEVDELEMIIEAEFEIGATLRDKIIPRAFGWFMGEEKDGDLESDSDDEEEDEDSDLDDSQDDE